MYKIIMKIINSLINLYYRHSGKVDIDFFRKARIKIVNMRFSFESYSIVAYAMRPEYIVLSTMSNGGSLRKRGECI